VQCALGLSAAAGARRQVSERYVAGALPLALGLHASVKYVLGDGLCLPLDWLAFSCVVRISPRERWIGSVPVVELCPPVTRPVVEEAVSFFLPTPVPFSLRIRNAAV